jgi:N-acetylglucosaminyldiphosphoundecaprenol N-acetyl-beta-D-mannosaminyltransferase
MKKIDKARLLFNLSLFSKDSRALLNKLIIHLKKGKGLKLIFTPNPEQVILSQDDDDFLRSLKTADYLIPDGGGLIMASKILSFCKKITPINHKITGVDLTSQLLKFAKQHNLRVMVIGGRNYSKNNSLIYKSQSIWWTEGFRNIKTPTADEQAKLELFIKKHHPAIIFVAFGAPSTEKWLVNNRRLLDENKVKIAMAVGGSFDYLLGKVKRAPEWMRKMNLEWLYRLINQPWRWRRQLRLVKFMGLVAKEIIR